MSGEFLTVAATHSAEQSAVDRAPLGVSDEAMTGAWRVIIARVPMADEKYWMYQSSFPTPSFDELPDGCFRGTEAQWFQLSPGMRREIVRSFKKLPDYQRLERAARLEQKEQTQIKAREAL